MSKWFDASEPVRAAMNEAGGVLTDAQASTVIPLYPGLKGEGDLIRSGTRVNWHGQLKRAAVDLWDTPENTPDKAPGLWEDINYRDGYRIIPAVITVGLAFSKGEKGWWGDVLYESVLDGPNVYTPEEYPSGWVVADV